MKQAIEYKQNGAGDVFRKQGSKIEAFYRGDWVHASFQGSDEDALAIWNMSVLVSITEAEAENKVYKGVQDANR